ncbi:MAG: hypothetical protein M9924_21940 [Rhizobiaceae bacterium]|nr:hypothetical protein [Rhizobiaceae bacterium]
MRKLLFALMITIAGTPFVSPASSQTAQQQPAPTQKFDPDQCGAGGMGCQPPDVQEWVAKGMEISNLPMVALSYYADACVKHPDWKHDCETDPRKVLRRIGITDF